jgi:hypothetical protein
VSVYPPPSTDPIHFHVKELKEAEFRAVLSVKFRNVELIRQQSASGSAILADAIGSGSNSLWVFEQRDRLTFEAAPRVVCFATICDCASSLPPHDADS